MATRTHTDIGCIHTRAWVYTLWSAVPNKPVISVCSQRSEWTHSQVCCLLSAATVYSPVGGCYVTPPPPPDVHCYTWIVAV